MAASNDELIAELSEVGQQLSSELVRQTDILQKAACIYTRFERKPNSLEFRTAVVIRDWAMAVNKITRDSEEGFSQIYLDAVSPWVREKLIALRKTLIPLSVVWEEACEMHRNEHKKGMH